MFICGFRARGEGHDANYSHPGVEAFGYVKRITPALLSSTNFFNVVFAPSWVSTSPPKPSRFIVSPEALALLEDAPLAGAAFLPPLALDPADLTELGFFAGGARAGSAALRLRNSTMLELVRKLGGIENIKEEVSEKIATKHLEFNYCKVLTRT